MKAFSTLLFLGFACNILLPQIDATPWEEAGLREFELRDARVAFLVPDDFEELLQDGTYRFSNPDGSLQFTFKKMPYARDGGPHADAKELVHYVSGKMKEHFSAHAIDIRPCEFSDLQGYQLSMDWLLEGTTIRQYEVSLETTDGILSFGAIGTPDSVDGNLQYFVAMLNSLVLGEPTQSPPAPTPDPASPALPFTIQLGSEWVYHFSDGTHLWTDMETRDPPSLLFYIPLTEEDIAGRGIREITQTARDKAEAKPNYTNVSKALPLALNSDIEAWHFAANSNENTDKARLEITIIVPMGKEAGLFQFNFPDDHYGYMSECIEAFQVGFDFKQLVPPPSERSGKFPREMLKTLSIGLKLAGFEGSLAVIDMEGRLVIALPLQSNRPVYELMLKSGALFAMVNKISEAGKLRILGIRDHQVEVGIEGSITRVNRWVNQGGAPSSVITVLDAKDLHQR